MNRDIAGNMISDVKGLSDVTAATAKELKATSRGIPPQSIEFMDCRGQLENTNSESLHTHSHNTNFAKHD